MEDKSLESKLSVFSTFMMSSDVLLNIFSQANWKERKRLFYSFERASKFHNLPDFLKIWFTALSQRMTMEIPIDFKSYRGEVDKFDAKMALSQIAEEKDP